MDFFSYVGWDMSGHNKNIFYMDSLVTLFFGGSFGGFVLTPMPRSHEMSRPTSLYNICDASSPEDCLVTYSWPQWVEQISNALLCQFIFFPFDPSFQSFTLLDALFSLLFSIQGTGL